MRTYQVALNDKLIDRVEKVIKRDGTTRSAFVAKALREAIVLRDKERRHAEGYRNHPITPGEFDVWESEQAWGKA